ncbi:lantibiotic dehydratase family protein [Azospirillum canadense]|uniref:lantibiotic dehydratase family protein n=1 Tax=Azospirillum canadense TaxID=403962 RepID=UPI002227F75D|nr:lantibiotic dehydratase family protein [Azospirillum canadense]MCW2241609.1 hypothetical protein [Azospirillum canadense]
MDAPTPHYRGPAHELAPRVVVRASLFPLSRLDAFAAPGLVRDALSDLDDAAFAGRYAEAMVAQQATLVAQTLDDPAFARALAFSSPAAYWRLAAKPPSPARDKKSRQAEQALYRWLARAAWRSTPCDLWAGTILASWGSRTSVRPARARYSIAPDVAPLAALFSGVAARPPHRTRGRFALVAGLTRVTSEDGSAPCWVLPASSGRPPVTAAPVVDQAMTALGGPPRRFERCVRRVAQATGRDAEGARRLCLALVAAGLLTGGLAFPQTFTTVWETLADAGRRLGGAKGGHEGGLWRAAVADLRATCRRLEATLDQATPEAVLAAQDEVGARVARLAADLSLPDPGPVALRCDAGLPARVTLGADQRDRLTALLEEVDRFELEHGLAAACADLHVRRTLAAAPSPAVDAPSRTAADWAAVARALEPGGVLDARVRGWERWLATGLPPLSAGDPLPPPPPQGTFVVRAGADALTVVGLAGESAMAFSRLGGLHGGPAWSQLTAWCGERLRQAAEAGGIDLRRLAPPPGVAHNALATPRRMRLPLIDPWRAADIPTIGRAGPDAPVLARQAGQRRPMPVSRQGRPMAVVGTCSVDLGLFGAAAEALLLTGGRVLAPWYDPEALPFATETADGAQTGAVLSRPLRLAVGAVIRPGRLTLTGPSLAGLLEAPNAAVRFRRWCRLMAAHGSAAHGVPELVTVTRLGEPPLAVRWGSPLAVEAALRGLPATLPHLVVAAPDPTGFLLFATGDRHATEIALPFHRRHHAWSRDRAGRTPLAADQRRA